MKTVHVSIAAQRSFDVRETHPRRVLAIRAPIHVGIGYAFGTDPYDHNHHEGVNTQDDEDMGGVAAQWPRPKPKARGVHQARGGSSSS